VTATLIYEVECQLDPDIVADYDAWLPGHVREVLACPGFHGAGIEMPETPPGERQRRRVRYRVESAAALDHYLENHATRLRTETAERFGARVHCERRVFRPRHDVASAGHESRRCLNCGSVVAGRHCAQCGQASDVHILSMKEVAGDVTHSLLHLDSRIWQTIKLLARRPGELTREFIAGRHQRYLPPFRLYLAISVVYFALQALLPGSESFNIQEPQDVQKKERAQTGPASGGSRQEPETQVAGDSKGGASILSGEDCNIRILDGGGKTKFERSMSAACRQMKADGGKRFAEHFATTAPKLMFLFLPLMAAVALLFYWKPRRLYAEHLVLFLHNHAFTFLLLAVTAVMTRLAALEFPLAGLLNLAAFLLWCYLPYYVFRSMRVVYGEGRFRTSLKFLSISVIYFLLLGITMLLGLVATMLSLS
jgi:uncharacterized protein DUF3667/uncharacterized protein DUF4286